MRTSSTLLGIAAAALLAGSGAAWAANTAAERLDAVDKQINGTGRAKLAPPSASTSQAIELDGILKTGADIQRAEQKAKDLVTRNRAQAATLAEKLKLLEGAARTGTVNRAEGALGAHSLGWYCKEASRLVDQLYAQVRGMMKLADDYREAVNQITIGRKDSAERLGAITGRLRAELMQSLNDSDAQAMRKAFSTVSDGLKATSGTYTTLEQMAGEARSSADALRKGAFALQETNVYLGHFLPLYRQAKSEALHELNRLQDQLDAPADKTRRASLENQAVQAYSPGAVYQFSGEIGQAVNDWIGSGDKALARAAELTRSLRDEGQQCPTSGNPQAALDGARQGAASQIAATFNRIAETYGERRRAIDKADREAAQIIDSNEKTAKEIGEKIQRAEARYDAMPKDSPEREALYKKIVAARKIGTQATEAAMNLRLAREGYVADQRAVIQQQPIVEGLKSTVMNMLGLGSN